MKAIIKPTFEIDVTDWYEDEGLSKKERIERIKESLEDFSVFMPNCEYKNLKDVDVIIN